jgi:hypothetical protein
MAVGGTLFWIGREGLKPSAIPAIGAVWSLASVAVVLVSVHRLADGAPFCLAHHGYHSTVVESVWELRWFSFYTTETGYKDTSTDYFHGVLAVETPKGDKIYNWSPRGMRFDPIDRPHLFRNPSLMSPCSPSPRFWQSLRVGL